MTPGVPLLVFSDLDGTLLDARTYAASGAEETLAFLKRARIPLVFCSSKTRAEIELIQHDLGVHHPFVVENGGALFIPDGYFDFDIPHARPSSGYQVVQYGRPYADVVDALGRASRRAGIQVVGFNDMSVEEVARECGLPLGRARLAKLRDYDEPFRMCSSSRGDRRKLEQALNAEGLGCSIGGRFDHAGGHVDKSMPVRLLTTLYMRAMGQVRTIGLGDADNDVALLRHVDVPVVVRGHSGVDSARVLASVPHASLTNATGPSGWAEGVTAIVAEAVRARRSSPLVAPRGGR